MRHFPLDKVRVLYYYIVYLRTGVRSFFVREGADLFICACFLPLTHVEGTRIALDMPFHVSRFTKVSGSKDDE